MANRASAIHTKADDNSWLLFVFCVSGTLAALSAMGSGKLSPLSGSGNIWHTVLSIGLPAAALLLSSSLLGVLLVPLCAFGFGALLCCITYSMHYCGGVAIGALAPYLVSVPAFFLIASAGMENSTVLCSAFIKSGQRLRGLWLRRFVITLMSAAVIALLALLPGRA